jgi:hypothetical protein
MSKQTVIQLAAIAAIGVKGKKAKLVISRVWNSILFIFRGDSIPFTFWA